MHQLFVGILYYWCNKSDNYVALSVFIFIKVHFYIHIRKFISF